MLRNETGATLSYSSSTEDLRRVKLGEAAGLHIRATKRRSLAVQHRAALDRLRSDPEKAASPKGRERSKILAAWARSADEKADRQEKEAAALVERASSLAHPWEAEFPGGRELWIRCRDQAWAIEPAGQLAQRTLPLPLGGVGETPELAFDGRYYWLYGERVYSTMEPLTQREVLALVTEKVNKSKAKLARAVALLDQREAIDDAEGRERIPDDVKIFVWQRDRGQCVNCGSKTSLEFDHIIPRSMGGSDSARNLQLLCENCNRSKGGSLV